MDAADASDIRILRCAGPDAIADPSDAAHRLLSHTWLDRAEILKQDIRSSVHAGELDGRPVILKILRLSRPKDHAARLFGATRLQREWRGYQALRHASLPGAEPLLLFRARTKGAGGSGGFEALATVRLPGETLLRAVAHPRWTPEQERDAAEETGRLTARLARAGLHNRDHKPSNIIINTNAPAGSRLSLIDAAGIRRRRDHSAETMLAKLAIELLGVHALPRSAQLMRCLRACAQELNTPHETKQLWRRIAITIEKHGDPTPKIDPLTH